MAKRETASKRVSSEASKIQSKTALARAKSLARSELKQIFQDEIKQRALEQHTLSRPAAASRSHS